MNPDLSQILLASQSPDPNIRQAAEGMLLTAESSNFPAYLTALAVELASNDKQPQSRQLAAIIFKNALHAKQTSQRDAYHERWGNVDNAVRNQIKQYILSSFASPVRDIWNAGSMLVAKIASIEIPRNSWPDIIPNLLSGISNQSASSDFKQACLQTMGYICEEMEYNPEALTADHANQILTGIAQGMNGGNDVAVRIVATKALLNALPYIEANFSRETERTFLMQTIFECCQSTDLNLKEAATSCLATIAYNYYEHIQPYMQHIFAYTINCIQAEAEPVALQALEVWNTLAEIEIELENDEDETNKNYCTHGAASLLPVFLQTMTKQSESLDDDWNPAMAAGTCLGLFSVIMKDAITVPVVAFIQTAISNPDWHYREAALMAFGCIMEGPSSAQLAPYIQNAIPTIANLVNDVSEVVRDTATWALGRICEFHGHVILDTQLEPVIHTLALKLKDIPHIANNACYGISSIAESFEESGEKLAPFARQLITALIEVTNRPDGDEDNLRPSAFEAVNSIINTCSDYDSNIAEQLVPYVLERLRSTYATDTSTANDRSHQLVLQGSLCGVLGTLTQKLEGKILAFAEQLMSVYINVFNSKKATVDEEALMAIGHLINAIEGEFSRYLPHFMPFLLACLGNFEEPMVCVAAVGVLSDLSRGVGSHLVPYTADCVRLLFEALRRADLPRENKTPVISVLGDVAMCLGTEFQPYLQPVVTVILEALQTQLDMNDLDQADYIHDLRESCYEAFSGILQGYGQAGANNIAYFVDDLARCLQVHANEEDKPDNLLRAMTALVGDMCSVLQARIVGRVPVDVVQRLVADCNTSEVEETRKIGRWASGEFRALSR